VVVVLMQFLTRRTNLARGVVIGAALIVALIVQTWRGAAQILARTERSGIVADRHGAFGDAMLAVRRPTRNRRPCA